MSKKKKRNSRRKQRRHNIPNKNKMKQNTDKSISLKKTTFSTVVIATMSSGKSTLLNAMLGEPILPSKNEACTAIITRMVDVDGMECVEARVTSKTDDVSDWYNINTENNDLLSEWNSAENRLIEIRGDFPHIDNYAKKIEFIDTPGPNNSMDKSHAQITHQLIKDSTHNFIVYVINATQFGVDDERKLLEKIAKKLKVNRKRSKIVFALNKIDEFDIELGETPSLLVDKAKKYLKECGFYYPTIIPTMSLISLQIRQCLEAHRTQKELPFRPRMQRKFVNSINTITDDGYYYIQALLNTAKKEEYLKRAFEQDRNIDLEEIVAIGGSTFSIKQLVEADMLTGIPFLEEMLELELIQDK